MVFGLNVMSDQNCHTYLHKPIGTVQHGAILLSVTSGIHVNNTFAIIS